MRCWIDRDGTLEEWCSERTRNRLRRGVGGGQSMLHLRVPCRKWMGPLWVMLSALAGILALLAACTVGPNYVRPTAEVPEAYKEIEGWKVAQPKDEVLREAWWEIFKDSHLNALEDQVNVSNQNLAVAEAQFRQARALVQVARAGYFPTITIGATFTRSLTSSNVGGPTGSSSTAGTSSNPPSKTSSPSTTTGPISNYLLPASASWEPDLWGRVRRLVESSAASAQASAADLQLTRLLVQAELAQNYFQLRALDKQKQLLDATVTAYQKFLELTKNRYGSGVASKLDVLQAETQLKTTQAQAIDVGVQRAQLEHAIALLVGRPASIFSIPIASIEMVPPAIPVGVPSELLERRPDIAAAERLMAAANAQIGVAIAAYYPNITLTASGGFQATDLAKWLTWPSRFWSVGAAIAETVFEGGLRRAQTAQARAAYDATVASYRQTVLTGFQEVEDNLVALRILEEEDRVQDEAVKAAQESVRLAINQYKAGTLSQLNVIVDQTVALNNEITAVGILSRRATASVLLVKALGGGWNASALPSVDDISGNDNKHQQSSESKPTPAGRPSPDNP
ncbi:MAG: efflux transporter outer membrane subunit [Thermodesulfobacteriota bacterium]